MPEDSKDTPITHLLPLHTLASLIIAMKTQRTPPHPSSPNQDLAREGRRIAPSAVTHLLPYAAFATSDPAAHRSGWPLCAVQPAGAGRPGRSRAARLGEKKSGTEAAVEMGAGARLQGRRRRMLQLREKPGDVSTLDMYACKRTLDMYAMQAHARGRLTAPDCSAGFRLSAAALEERRSKRRNIFGTRRSRTTRRRTTNLLSEKE